MKTTFFTPRLPQPNSQRSPQLKSNNKQPKSTILSPRSNRHKKTDSADFQLQKTCKISPFFMEQLHRKIIQSSQVPHKNFNQTPHKDQPSKFNTNVQQKFQQWNNDRKRMATENGMHKQRNKFDMPKWFVQKKEREYKLKKSGSTNFVNFQNDNFSHEKQFQHKRNKSRGYKNVQLRQNDDQNQKKRLQYLQNSLKQQRNMMQLEMRVLKLQEMNKKLHYELDIVDEDKNLLISHNQALQSQVKYYKGKIKQNQKREQELKQIEISLRNRIRELEEQIQNKGEDKKNNLMETGFTDSTSRIYNIDKEIMFRKNQQISRLNQIINKTRERVCDLNKNLTQEKEKNLTKIHQITHFFEIKLAQKDQNIAYLCDQISKFKSLESFNWSNPKPKTENQKNYDLVIPKRDRQF